MVCNPRSSSAIAEVSLTIVTTKVHKRKGENTENEGDEAPVTTATNKGCKRKRKNSESQSNSDPFGLMINQFDKRYEGTEKKLQQPSNKNSKIGDTFKFNKKGTNYNMSSTRKFCKLFKIIADHRLKSYVDQFYVGKLLPNTRQIQSLVTQKTERRLRQAENRTLSKRKSKKSKKTTVGLPSHRASDQ